MTGRHIIAAALVLLVAALALAAHAEPPPAPQGKKDMVTQWTCTGSVDCDDVAPCDYKNKPASDPGGDIRRAVLRLIFACAEERKVEARTCRNRDVKCRPPTGGTQAAPQDEPTCEQRCNRDVATCYGHCPALDRVCEQACADVYYACKRDCVTAD